MEQALVAVQLVFFIMGVGVLWFVSVYKEKKE